MLNHTSSVVRIGNKLNAMETFHAHGVTCPQFFTSRTAAATHMRETNCHIMARTVLTGHSGNGIVYCSTPDELPEASLYTTYIKKAAEYRVHFMGDGRYSGVGTPPMFIQRKAKRSDVSAENVDWKVRNREGGFIYANDPSNVGDVPECVIREANRAFLASALNFGAVDVIYNKKKGQAYVLEINTAPGLQGRTLEFYATNLKSFVERILR